LEDHYPPTPIERYAYWSRPDGRPFDPWMWVHARLGCSILRAEPKSMEITASAADWERRVDRSPPEDAIEFFNRVRTAGLGVLQLIFAVGLLRRLTAGDASGGALPRLSYAGSSVSSAPRGMHHIADVRHTSGRIECGFSRYWVAVVPDRRHLDVHQPPYSRRWRPVGAFRPMVDLAQAHADRSYGARVPHVMW
jgi:hypothetical protein